MRIWALLPFLNTSLKNSTDSGSALPPSGASVSTAQVYLGSEMYSLWELYIGQYWEVGMSSQSVMPDGIAAASGGQCTMPPMSMLELPDADRHCQSSHCTYLNGMPCFVHCAFTASSACSWFAKPEWLLLESKNACPHDNL